MHGGRDVQDALGGGEQARMSYIKSADFLLSLGSL